MPIGLDKLAAVSLAATCTLLLTSCSASHKSTAIQQLQTHVIALNSRVAALEAAQARMTTATAGPWIEWQRSDVLSSTAMLSSLAPARAIDAFVSRDECERAAQQLAAGHGGKPGAVDYIVRDRLGVSRIFYTCIPKGVPVTW